MTYWMQWLAMRLRAGLDRRTGARGGSTPTNHIFWFIGALALGFAVLGVIHYILIPWLQGQANAVTSVTPSTTGTAP